MKTLTSISIFIGLIVLGTSAWADIAKVNAKSLTDADLKAEVSSLGDAQAKSLLEDTSSRRQLVNRMIEQELLVQKGEAEKLDQSADYKRAQDNFRRQYLINAVLEKNLGGKLSDKAAKKYYEDNKSLFSTDQARAYHILAKSEKEARDMLKQATQKDADFQALAEKYSKDPSAKMNRGDLGFFTRERMVREFADAVFNGKQGQIVGPVKTQFGYHVIKIVEFKAGKIPNFDEVELQARNGLRQSLIEQYVNGLRKTAKVEITDPKLR
jgi:peptidyl-prolyl cis-trans isomerase C